ncbi:MAG: class I SAM-dependent methyltransferase [Hyphomicrobiales bacterium]
MNNKASLFHQKAKIYEEYRPDYPLNTVKLLEEKAYLKKGSVIAEIGCGTGKFTDLLLDEGYQVAAVEPDHSMSAILESKHLQSDLRIYNCFAEQTPFEDHQFNAIISAQSFHFFHTESVRNEFFRILKKDGDIVVLWYLFDTNLDISNHIQNLFIKYGDLQNQPRRHDTKAETVYKCFSGCQISNDDSYKYRIQYSKDKFLKNMLSSSYAPNKTSVLYSHFLEDFTNLYTAYSDNGIISCEYKLDVYHIRNQ